MCQRKMVNATTLRATTGFQAAGRRSKALGGRRDQNQQPELENGQGGDGGVGREDVGLVADGGHHRERVACHHCQPDQPGQPGPDDRQPLGQRPPPSSQLRQA